MALQTGENDQALRKIIDLTRWIAVGILLVHFYYYGYSGFRTWQLQHDFIDRCILVLKSTGIFSHFLFSKALAFIFLCISFLGTKGRKDEKINFKTSVLYLFVGCLLYFSSSLIWQVKIDLQLLVLIYSVIVSIGFLIFLKCGTWLSRIISIQLNNQDIFNLENETFPQMEVLLENEYSINLPAEYRLKSKVRNSWINIINPFRGMLVMGTPGSGKTYFIIRNIIAQHLQKGFSMFIYDFKYDDLTKIAYSLYLKNRNRYKIIPKFYVINFDDLDRTHRCNPIDPSTMLDISDAAESARSILLGLNREWIKRQGDFFVESPINFLTAIIWYLRCYRNGEFCTLPHVIELLQVDYDTLFSILCTNKEIEVLINPFIYAYLNDAMEQLEGQIASTKIALARLSSPKLYYVLSGNDFTLDINNPDQPKIVCLGNNPLMMQTYGAVLSLYINRLVKLVNQKGKLKCSLIFDEFPTIYLNNMDSLIATARDNLVSTCLAVQDLSQLRKDYGREQAEVIMNIVGNVISGQVTGDTAKQLSDRFGKIMQDRESISINSGDTSISRSKQLEYAIPASKISSLSSGEFVGMVADNPANKIVLKTFHCSIVQDSQNINDQKNFNQDLPMIRHIPRNIINTNYNQIRLDIQNLVICELNRIHKSPAISCLIIKK